MFLDISFLFCRIAIELLIIDVFMILFVVTLFGCFGYFWVCNSFFLTQFLITQFFFFLGTLISFKSLIIILTYILGLFRYGSSL